MKATSGKLLGDWVKATSGKLLDWWKATWETQLGHRERATSCVMLRDCVGSYLGETTGRLGEGSSRGNYWETG